ncbi:flagellar basal-body rod protein FlgB [Gammaproteobacteria bacterium]
MPINFSQALGIHPEALSLRARRAEILAGNLSNADTPYYKARDIDFKSILSGIQDQNENPQVAMNRTHPTHLEGTLGDTAFPLKYRMPNQPSVDENTVDPDLERAEFASNALGYQASITFLDGRVRTMLTAIKGE